jgi:hypothetical protein
MASGVPAEKGFEALLEDHLNHAAVPPSRFEILNFAVGGYDVMQAFIVAEEKVFRFSPNAVAIGIEALARERVLDHLTPLVRFQSAIPYPYILKKYAEARVEPSMTRAELRARLRPVTGDVVRWSLQRIATSCRKHGVPAFLFLIPRTQADHTDSEELAQIAKWAKDAGFIVIDATNAYGALPPESVWISSFDQHPNVRGHELIADAIYAQLSRNGTFKQELASSSRK